MNSITQRIDAWQAAGLVDAATADRLRAAEGEAASGPSANGSDAGSSTLANVFGPAPTIGEMFAYLGGGFVLAAVEIFVLRALGPEGQSGPMAAAAGVMAVLFGAIGFWLSGSPDERRRRAAGVAFLVATGHAAAAGAALAATVEFGWGGVVSAGLASLVATVGRRIHPALLTQFGLLSSLTALVQAGLELAQRSLLPQYDPFGGGDTTGADPILLVVLGAVVWLGFALGLGILGLREARGDDADPAAGRRAALTRLWAGLTAVGGLALSLTRSDYNPVTGGFGRIIEPWMADVALLILAGILVERAFRREASTFVYAAAVALMIALTDFNFSYITTGLEAGLLGEGLILLAAGFAADRLRRRIGRDDGGDGGDASVVDPAPA